MNEFLKQLETLCSIKQNNISLLANASALIKQYYKDVNWVGFYILNKRKLVLGPFQGKPACTTIDIGKGVCGVSFEKRMLTNVSDVHKFEGHIACDSDTNSEIVVPLIYEDKRFGVLDIDSASYSRFTGDDEYELEEAAKIISKALANN